MPSTIQIECSLAQGGLFYRLQEWLRLVNENDSRVVVRAIIFAVVSWFPLLILAAWQGLAVDESPHRSLLLDFTAYGRFLIAVPLMIIAENVLDDRYVIITSYFFNSEIVPESERPKYLELLSFARRLAISIPAEIIILTLAFLLAGLSISLDLTSGIESWRITENRELSLAGWWSLLFSIPFFNFLLLRWFWRLIIWCIFLWQLSRLKLALISTHPDFVGGLGILAESLHAFAPIIFTVSALLASSWGNRILYEGANVTEFHRPFLGFLIITILISIAPLLIFTRQLIRLKLRGLHDYGVLANRHSLLFDEKWIRQAEKNIASVLGTPDISSLCDLTTDYQTVQKMKFFPFRLQNLTLLVAAACIPMIPLLLIEIPLRDLLVKIAGVLL